MSNYSSNDIVRLHPAQAALRAHFLGWQCRVRQYAVRHAGGRPCGGMQPRVLIAGEPLSQIIVLINKRKAETITTEFRHLVLRTQDPAERYNYALRKLAEAYFQRAEEFSDRLTALFGPTSSIAQRLVNVGECKLEFDFQRQYYLIPCAVMNLPEHDPAFQVTYWHNRLFNPAMPPGVQVLSFIPDWSTAEANPSPD